MWLHSLSQGLTKEENELIMAMFVWQQAHNLSAMFRKVEC